MNKTIKTNPVKAAPLPDAQPTKSPARLRLIKKTPPAGQQSEKIRAELNIEKWPGIWRPASSNNKPTVRILERELKDPEGSIIRSRVEIGFTQWGTLTTEEQKMFYALVKQWEDSGKLDAQVFFSDRLLQRLLKKSWGTNVIEAMTKALRKLRSTPIEWTNSYHNKTETGVVLKDRRVFTILSELRIVEREVDGSTNKALGYFKFDDQILNNLLKNYTKPLLLDTILSIQSEIGQLLYVHVDLMLARKDFYERRSKELFQDLGLTNPEYDRQYERKRKLQKAITELIGLPLSTGMLKVARVEKTNDKQDYKVVFQKVSHAYAALTTEPEQRLGEIPEQSIVVNDYSKAKDPSIVQAEEIVKHFHKIFHAVENHSPQSKETAQALSLISQHGIDQARNIIDFARGAAELTAFKIQHFGGVLSYTSRAIADRERRQHSQEESKIVLQRQAEQAQQEEESHELGERRLAALTTEQYQVRHDRAKEDLFRRFPFMARQRENTKIHQAAIRAQVIRDLENESMDLLVIDQPADQSDTQSKDSAQNLPL